MSDLSSMIDDTTERLLRKIDNWEVPQSDKEYVTIEKEVWESTLRVSKERAGEIEMLQKQLDIAIDTLKVYAEVDNWYNIYKQNIFDETPVAFKQKWKTEKGYKPALDCLKKILKIMQELANGEK